jgi:NADPH-dependent curcumin reductase
MKCDYAVNEFDVDACVDYRADGFSTRLAAPMPAGIDIYFEIVEGAIFDAVLPHRNPFARIPLCGMTSDYNSTEHFGIRNLGVALNNRIKMQGFIISYHLDRWSEALTGLTRLVRDGQIKYRETITQGLENAPKTLVGLFKRENNGKQPVRLT